MIFWVRHFLHKKNNSPPIYKFGQETRSFLARLGRLAVPLGWCFLLLGLYGSTCITVGAQGDPLQAGGARAQRWILLLITIIIGDGNGRTRRLLCVIPQVLHLIIGLTLGKCYWGIVGIASIDVPGFWRTNGLSLWGLRHPRLAPPLVHSVHRLYVSTGKLRGVSIGPPLRSPPKTILCKDSSAILHQRRR